MPTRYSRSDARKAGGKDAAFKACGHAAVARASRACRKRHRQAARKAIQEAL